MASKPDTAPTKSGKTQCFARQAENQSQTSTTTTTTTFTTTTTTTTTTSMCPSTEEVICADTVVKAYAHAKTYGPEERAARAKAFFQQHVRECAKGVNFFPLTVKLNELCVFRTVLEEMTFDWRTIEVLKIHLQRWATYQRDPRRTNWTLLNTVFPALRRAPARDCFVTSPPRPLPPPPSSVSNASSVLFVGVTKRLQWCGLLVTPETPGGARLSAKPLRIDTETLSARAQMRNSVVVRDQLYVPTHDDAICVLRLDTGEAIRRIATGNSGAVLDVSVLDGVVYLLTESGGILRLDDRAAECVRIAHVASGTRRFAVLKHDVDVLKIAIVSDARFGGATNEIVQTRTFRNGADDIHCDETKIAIACGMHFVGVRDELVYYCSTVEEAPFYCAAFKGTLQVKRFVVSQDPVFEYRLCDHLLYFVQLGRENAVAPRLCAFDVLSAQCVLDQSIQLRSFWLGFFRFVQVAAAPDREPKTD